MLDQLEGEALIMADLDALRTIWPTAQIRPSYAGRTWQVWDGDVQLSVPVGEPSSNYRRTLHRAQFVAGKQGRFQLDDMVAAGIPCEIRGG